MIDLAVPAKSVPLVELLGAPATSPEPVAVPEERLARIARADRRAARRHAFFAGINALSKADRRVAAACSFLYAALAVGLFMVTVQLGQAGADVVLLSMASLGAAGVYGGRVIFPQEQPSSNED